MEKTPTKEECWDAFWDRATDYLANLMRSGWNPEVHTEQAAA